jgi:hypothetical protein
MAEIIETSANSTHRKVVQEIKTIDVACKISSHCFDVFNFISEKIIVEVCGL